MLDPPRPPPSPQYNTTHQNVYNFKTMHQYNVTHQNVYKIKNVSVSYLKVVVGCFSWLRSSMHTDTSFPQNQMDNYIWTVLCRPRKFRRSDNNLVDIYLNRNLRQTHLHSRHGDYRESCSWCIDSVFGRTHSLANISLWKKVLKIENIILTQ